MVIYALSKSIGSILLLLFLFYGITLVNLHLLWFCRGRMV